MKFLCPLALAILLSGCATAPNTDSGSTKVDVGKEEAAIRATDAQWAEAVKARDAQRAASFWSDDASIVMPGQPPIHGKEAIKKFVADSLKSPDFSVTWQTERIEVAASGDLAYQTARDTITYRGPRNKLVTENNHALVIWKKQTDGSWKAQIDMWTPAEAPAK